MTIIMTSEEQKTIDTLMELKQLLQTENEHLYQQYNHLMIRNQKLMQRIDDQQSLNDRLQARIEELENVIDKMRQNRAAIYSTAYISPPEPAASVGIDTLKPSVVPIVPGLKSRIDLTPLIDRWGTLAGDAVKNTPTKLRQMQMLSLLYEHEKMSGLKLFMTCGITGVSGARYISALKHFGVIEFSGYRKGGYYFITDKGKKLVEGETI
jgi:predicted transcriptional regulator